MMKKTTEVNYINLVSVKNSVDGNTGKTLFILEEWN